MSARAPRRRPAFFVGDKIRQLRKERDLTQSALAARVGVQQSDLCRMEKGEYKVSLETLFKVLGVFGMDIGEFFHGDLPTPSATEMEREIVRLFQRLDEATRLEVLDYVRFKATRRQEP